MDIKKKIKNAPLLSQFTLLSFELMAVILTSLTIFFMFYWLSSLVIGNEIEAFDEKVYSFVRYFASPLLDKVMLSSTFFGDRQFVVFPLLGLLIYYLFLKPHKWYMIKIPVVAIGSITLNLLLKQLYSRARPSLEHMVAVDNFSFPSGHAMFSMSFYGLLIYIGWREINNKTISLSCCSLLGLLIILIGISRIYLGVHYPSDVFAGFLAGLFWLIVTLSLIDFIERKFTSNQKIPPN